MRYGGRRPGEARAICRTSSLVNLEQLVIRTLYGVLKFVTEIYPAFNNQCEATFFRIFADPVLKPETVETRE